MIAVDTSALVAIIFDEPERDNFVKLIVDSNTVLVSSVSVVEARMVVHARRGPQAVIVLDDFLALPCFKLTAPCKAQIDAASAAFVMFGKGSGHPAGLNFGDVFSYALAKTQAIPLLFKGDDFAQTDLVSARI
jgi:ribonuclease VapC